MTKQERDYYQKKYSHLNLYFSHYEGWDELTLTAAILIDNLCWPKWMPNWFKRFNNRLLFGLGGKSIVRITPYHYQIKKLFPFIKEYTRFSQIKEKYGSLCLYTMGGQPRMIHHLELLSHITCERCGERQAGTIDDGWVFTVCEDCAKKLYPNRKWKMNTLSTDGKNSKIECDQPNE